MPVNGLQDYRLTVAGLARLGARPVTFSIQLSGVPLDKLLPFAPRARNTRLRASLKRQLANLSRRFPQAELRSREPRKGSWTLDGVLPANQIRRLAAQPEVACVSLSAIEGRSKYKPRAKAKEGWFCVWGVVAIQVEGQRLGTISLEDRLVLVKALDEEDAVNRLRPTWEQYAEPYLNSSGHLVRWQLVGVNGVYSLCDETLSPQGTEVYSRLRTVNIKPKYQWKAARLKPGNRL